MGGFLAGPAEGRDDLGSACFLEDYVQVQTWKREGNRLTNYCLLDPGSNEPTFPSPRRVGAQSFAQSL